MKKTRRTLKALLLALAWASPVLATDPPQYTGTLAVTDVSGAKLFVNNRSGGDGLGFLARSVTITATGNTCFVDLGDTLSNSLPLAGSPVATTADTPVVQGTPLVVNLGTGYNPPAGWAGLAGICSAGQSATWTITANRYDTPSVTVTSTGATVAGADKQIQFNDGGSALGGDARLTFDKTAGAFASTAPSTLGTGYGSEMVTNGTFTGNATGWTLGGGGGTPDWFYNSNNVSHANGAATATLTPTTPLTIIVGRAYKLVFTLSARTAGTVTAALGGSSGTAADQNGTYEQHFVATTTGNLTFTPTATFDGTLDTISVVEYQPVYVPNLTANRLMFGSGSGRLRSLDWTTVDPTGGGNFAITFRKTNPTAGGDNLTHPFFALSGTLNEPLSGFVAAGVKFQITTPVGTADNIYFGFNTQLVAGYTGTSATTAVRGYNGVNGTGPNIFGFDFAGASGGNFGVLGRVVNSAATTAADVGVMGHAQGGLINVGTGGAATTAAANTTNVGGIFIAANSGGGTKQVGLYVGLQAASNPTFTSGALLVNNGGATDPIAIFQDNGTAKVTIADGGQTTFAAGLISNADTRISGTTATNVEIGSTTNAANAGSGGTSTVIGNGAVNSINSAGVTAIGSSVVVSTVASANVTAVGSSLTIGNGGGGCANGVVIGTSHTCNVTDSLVIGRGLVTSATGQAIIANSTTPYTDYIFGKGLAAASPPATITFHGTSSRAGVDNNVSGSGLIFTAGLGTGSSAVSTIVFKTPAAVGSGTGAQTETTQLTLSNGSATFAGSLFAPNGSTASPGYAFSADSASGSGFYLQNNGVIGMVSQGTEKIRMSGSSVNLAPTQRLTWGTAIGSADIGLSRDAAGILAIDGGAAATAGCTKMPTANGAYVLTCSASEILTLATGATTTDTTANLLPADSIIDAVVTRVTTTITTAVSFSVGDPTTAARFSASAGGMSAGSTRVGIDHMSGAVTTLAAGPSQAAAAKVRITTNANPGAGAIRITVFYRQFVAPTS